MNFILRIGDRFRDCVRPKLWRFQNCENFRAGIGCKGCSHLRIWIAGVQYVDATT